MPSRRRATIARAALVAAAALAGGCGGSDRTPSTHTTAPGRSAPAPTTAPATAPTAPATAPTGIDTMAGAGVGPVVARAESRRTALLSRVRAARHEGFDRVVFAFTNTLPGYDVRYVRPPVAQDGSGRPVAVAGPFVVRIRMENAGGADLSRPRAPRTYRGPARIRPGTPEVVELASAGGFEGVLTWAVGLRDRVDFRVTTLIHPPRLVIDFRNH